MGSRQAERLGDPDRVRCVHVRGSVSRQRGPRGLGQGPVNDGCRRVVRFGGPVVVCRDARSARC